MKLFPTSFRFLVVMTTISCSAPSVDVFGGDVVAEQRCHDARRNDLESDVDCGRGCDACLDGRMCGGDEDCVSGVCVPTVASSGDVVGRCWGSKFKGCAVVATDAATNTRMCSDLHLAICQEALNHQMWDDCFGPMTTEKPWNATFLCCPTAVFNAAP